MRERAQTWWRSRIGWRLVAEAALIYSLFLLYKFVRFLAKGQADAAFHDSELVWAWQGLLGIANEARLQAAVLASPKLVVLLNYYYVMMHFSTTGLFLAWVYVFRGAGYPHVRRLFVISILYALAVHVVFPLAPPRMHPEWGFVDTMARYGPTSYGDQAFASTANQFAAMPSVHFLWACLVAYGVIRYTRTRWRWLVLAHPSMTLAGVVLTANHYWLDAVGAAGILLLTLALEPTVARVEWRRLAVRPRGTMAAPPNDGPLPAPVPEAAPLLDEAADGVGAVP